MESLYLISAGLTGFFIAILLSKPAKKRHDLILILWLSLILFHVVVSYQETRQPFTYLLEISSALVFLHGPLLYVYTLAVISPDIRFRRRLWLQLLPFAIYIVVVLPFIINGELAPFSLSARDWLAVAKLAILFIYGVLILRLIRYHLQQAKQTLSTLDKVQLNWIRFMVYGVFMVGIIGIGSQVFKHVNWIESSHEDMLVNIAVSILVAVLGYYGFRQTPVFISSPAVVVKEELSPPPLSTESDASMVHTPVAKYQRSGLEADKSKLLAQQLAAFMEENKPFTDPELSLDSLAGQINIPANHLSQIINEQFGQHFWDFVNEFRVKAVIKAFEKGTHHKLTLLAIALDAGFNSKASFNRAFKKFTGKTPTEFLNKG